MALPPADNNAQKHQQDAKPTRISKIPSRPTSRRGDSERRPTSYSAMTTGSPRSNAISPPPQNTKSPAASSKIPQPPSTPSHHPIPRASRPMSAVQAPRSNLPRALSARETPTVKSPLNLVRTANNRIAVILTVRRSTLRRIFALASTSLYPAHRSLNSLIPTAHQSRNVLLSMLKPAPLQRISGRSSGQRISLPQRLY